MNVLVEKNARISGLHMFIRLITQRGGFFWQSFIVRFITHKYWEPNAQYFYPLARFEISRISGNKGHEVDTIIAASRGQR